MEHSESGMDRSARSLALTPWAAEGRDRLKRLASAADLNLIQIRED
jgi:hypothetical protein